MQRKQFIEIAYQEINSIIQDLRPNSETNCLAYFHF